MPLVKRGNKELTIRNDELNRYLSDGYDLIDENGKVIQSGESNNATALKEENAELKQTVEKQAKQIADLEKQLKAKKKKQ